MNLFNIKGKNAIITGANRGLGKGVAEGLLDAGCHVVLIARNPKTQKIVDEYKKQGKECDVVFCDLANREERGKAFDTAVSLCNGKLDILVNVAGVQIRHPAEEFPLEDFDEVMEINLNATYDYCIRAARVMLPNKSGKIINFASMLSWFGGYTVSAYAASKGGVAQITKAFSNEWAAKGVNVNAIAPGYISTDNTEALRNNPIRSESILSRIPAKRWGNPEDFAGPIVFLCSDAAQYMHGSIMVVDGGWMGR